MHWFFLTIIVLAIGALIVGPLLNADTKSLAKGLRIAGAIVVLAVAGALMLTGRTGFGLPLAGFGVMMFIRAVGWGGGRLGSFGFQGQANKSAGQQSRVRSAWLEMTLDHDSGEMSGQFVSGPNSGRSLSDIPQAELIAAYADLLAQDGQSAQLLQAYLDRHHEAWREAFESGPYGDDQQSAHNRASGTGSSGPMSLQEAYEILGLSMPASKADIGAAHRRLMKKLHPDQGGSTILAAKVNQAKDIALDGR